MGFRYLAVMISMVLGFGLTTLCGGIGNLVQIRRRVKLYWLHSLWVVLLLVLHVHLWWVFWSLRGVADWTYWRSGLMWRSTTSTRALCSSAS